MKTLLATIGLCVFVVALFSFVFAAPASTAVADFYKGKTLQIVSQGAAGGGYDTCARVVAPALARETGTTVIVRNIAPAGGLVCYNYIYNTAKPDGLTIGMHSGFGMALNELLGIEAVKYQFGKFTWLGRMVRDDALFLVGKASTYKSMDDIKKVPLVKFGATGGGSMFTVFPVVLALAMGTENFKGAENIKVSMGYPGGAEVHRALLQGEVQAVCETYPTALPLLQSGDLIPIAWLCGERPKDMPLAQVPTIFELYPKIPPQNKMLIDAIIGANELGRVFDAPPGVPGDRATYLEGVLKKVISEREVIDKARTLRLELNYLSRSDCLEPIKKVALTKEARTQLQTLMKKYTE